MEEGLGVAGCRSFPSPLVLSNYLFVKDVIDYAIPLEPSA